MQNPWPRRRARVAALACLALLGLIALRALRPVGDMRDLRDAVGDHGAMLSAGHASLGSGASSCAYCHFAHASKAQRPLWQTQGNVDAEAYARESMQAGGVKTGLCMSCHDGTVAPALRAHSTSPSSVRQPHQSMSLGSSHPVGVDYMAAVSRRPDAYNDPAAPGVVLEDGKVGCVSCHATHDLAALSAGNVRADACTACHRY